MSCVNWHFVLRFYYVIFFRTLFHTTLPHSRNSSCLYTKLNVLRMEWSKYYRVVCLFPYRISRVICMIILLKKKKKKKEKKERKKASKKKAPELWNEWMKKHHKIVISSRHVTWGRFFVSIVLTFLSKWLLFVGPGLYTTGYKDSPLTTR